jgi:ribonuclease HI
MPPKKKKYYAYLVPSFGARVSGSSASKSASVSTSKSGIADDWNACEKLVSGKVGARFKGFEKRSDAEAWLADGAMYESKLAKPRPKLEPGIYFDAGTGRGDGVEISVTDEHGKNLLHKAISRGELNKFGKHLVGDAAATNNYGELLALHYALEIAHKERVKRIFGDSKLVIDYWSKWHIKRKELPQETVALADEVSRAREIFEKTGGTMRRISGDYNPADLGFHR